MADTNPLLRLNELPQFDVIKPEHAVPAIEQRINEVRTVLNTLECQNNSSWADVIEPLDKAMDALDQTYAPVRHLNSVMNNDDWRAAIDTILPQISELYTEIGQNSALFQHYQTIKESDEFDKLASEQQRSVDIALRDFLLAGVHLPDSEKKVFRGINEKLSTLQNKFSNNVLDATEAFTIHLTDVADLAGLPETTRTMAAQAAQSKDKEGWLFTLHAPFVIPVLTYSENRALREKMHKAYNTRASDEGPNAGEFDNSALMEEILELRRQKAELLKFDNYAELSMAPKMADNAAAVNAFLVELAQRAHPRAKDEMAALTEFAKAQGADLPLKPWDIGYWSEQLRQHRYAFNDEEVRPYFPAEHVVDGMFAVVKRLFNIDISAAEASIWHPDVRFFHIVQDGEIIGHFYLDLFAREGKNGGAWMADCRSRWREGKNLHLPAAFLTCNFSPPTGEDPSLLTHNEVITLFHEFGHGLHHLLTRVETLDVSGISGVPWDAVELPSQFLENWCWEEAGLMLISKHYQTGEALPQELLAKMKEARNFQSAMGMVRQLEFSLFDIYVHQSYAVSNKDIQNILDAVRERYSVAPKVSYNRFQHGFSHIFAGGYAAGYYSYKWAEVLSADAFSRFEEEGVMNAEVGGEFRETVLANGGARDAMELFVAFRGREPSIEPLLRHNGLA